MLDKSAFFENKHFDIKKKCDKLKSENQMFKNESILRKEELHSCSKRLNDLIHSGLKSFDERGLGFINRNATPSIDKQVFGSNMEN